MTKTDIRIYKACLTVLKNGTAFNKSSVARLSNLDNKTIRNRIEVHVFQDLNKFKNILSNNNK